MNMHRSFADTASRPAPLRLRPEPFGLGHTVSVPIGALEALTACQASLATTAAMLEQAAAELDHERGASGFTRGLRHQIAAARQLAWSKII